MPNRKAINGSRVCSSVWLKPNVADPAIAHVRLMDLLKQKGAEVALRSPHLGRRPMREHAPGPA